MIVRPPVWVATLAERFWAEVGEPPDFPRNLRNVACWLTDLHVQEVPGLTLAHAAEHFTRAGIPCPAPPIDRPLRGCFGSHCGAHHILIDPTDTPDQLRFTYAHELAHFLRDCREVRRQAVATFGPGILEVLNGLRPATFDERLSGVLRGVTIGAHTHFLDRDDWGQITDESAREAEEAADQLTFELLAPFDAVNPASCPSRAALTDRLISTFGLPAPAAAQYAAQLLR